MQIGDINRLGWSHIEAYGVYPTAWAESNEEKPWKKVVLIIPADLPATPQSIGKWYPGVDLVHTIG